MSRYSLSIVGMSIAVSLGIWLRHNTPALSPTEVYKILFVLFIACFAVGKLWPNLFTKKHQNFKDEVLQADKKESTEDAKYYIKHKKLMWVIYVFVIVVILISILRPDKV